MFLDECNVCKFRASIVRSRKGRIIGCSNILYPSKKIWCRRERYSVLFIGSILKDWNVRKLEKEKSESSPKYTCLMLHHDSFRERIFAKCRFTCISVSSLPINFWMNPDDYVHAALHNWKIWISTVNNLIGITAWNYLNVRKVHPLVVFCMS